MSEEIVLATYRLQLLGPDRNPQRVWKLSQEILEETEENLTDLLPPGYSVRIREEEK